MIIIYDDTCFQSGYYFSGVSEEPKSWYDFGDAKLGPGVQLYYNRRSVTGMFYRFVSRRVMR